MIRKINSSLTHSRTTMSDEVTPMQLTFKLNYPECMDCSLDQILNYPGDKLLLLPLRRLLWWIIEVIRPSPNMCASVLWE